MSKNRHINAIKKEITIEFAEFLIENALNNYDKNFDTIIVDFGKNPFVEFKESTLRGYYSSLRLCVRKKWYRRVSILPYWFSTLWDKECFNRGLQAENNEASKEEKEQKKEQSMFVSFAHPNGFGNLVISINGTISDVNDIRNIENFIKRDNPELGRSVVVLNFREMEKEDEKILLSNKNKK